MIYTLRRFSSIEENQKEFGVISDLYHSGIKRTYKKVLGKPRRALANKILESAVKDNEKFEKASKALGEKTPINLGSERRKSLYLEAKQRKAGVIGIPKQDSGYNPNPKPFPKISKGKADYMERTGQINKSEKKKILKRTSRINKKLEEKRYKNGLITRYGPEGDEVLAHELGHLENRHGSNIKDNLINRLDPILGSWSKGRNGKIFKSGLKAASSELRLLEEKNASKKGIKFLEKAGATDEELELAKKNLDLASDTYRYGGRRDYKRHLAEVIGIPSQKDKIFKKLR